MAILIPATTTAVTSDEFATAQNNTTSLVCKGLGAGEIVKLQVKDDVTDTFIDALIDGVVAQMNANNPMMVIYLDANIYQIVKPVTVNPVGVTIRQNVNPAKGI